MNRKGYTLLELLTVIFVVSGAIVIGKIVASVYGGWSGAGAGLLTGVLCSIILAVLDRRHWQRQDRRLQELREKYHSIYRVIVVPTNLKIIIRPDGAEIKIGDFGWEAWPSHNDGLIYLHGLTPEWTVVWHAGFRQDQIEWVADKPNSQYDSWYQDWATPPPLPPCPFPIVDRETPTIGRPHYTHHYVVDPTPSVGRRADRM